VSAFGATVFLKPRNPLERRGFAAQGLALTLSPLGALASLRFVFLAASTRLRQFFLMSYVWAEMSEIGSPTGKISRNVIDIRALVLRNTRLMPAVQPG